MPCRRVLTRAALVVSLLLAATATAHIKLTEPDNFQVTGTLGDPQKTAPCGGAGTASNLVTTVEAGSTLTVRWTETIGHPGHFRLGIATSPSDFVTPAAVVTNNDCKSAPIETSPSYPTLVDGLFPHTTAPSGVARTTTVTVPMVSCENCTLQLMQFMASHTPPCFYFQCARLKIVMPDAGAPADAGAGGDDAGTGGGAATGGGGGGGSADDAGTGGGGGGAATGGGSAADAGVGPGAEAGGCGCAALDGSVALALAALALRWRRRAR